MKFENNRDHFMSNQKIKSAIEKYLRDDSLAKQDLLSVLAVLNDEKDRSIDPEDIQKTIDILSSKTELNDSDFNSWISGSWLYITFILRSIEC